MRSPVSVRDADSGCFFVSPVGGPDPDSGGENSNSGENIGHSSKNDPVPITNSVDLSYIETLTCNSSGKRQYSYLIINIQWISL
jgi:hypothetical protein